MKRCHNIPLLISRSLDGDLASGETAELTSHLAVCEKCSRLKLSYMAQKELVAASFTEKPLPIDAVASMIAGGGRKSTVWPRLFHRYGLAGTGFTLMAVITAVFFFSHSQRSVTAPPTVLLESSYPSTMCIPFSAIIYYEEYAGNAVHSQFVKVAPQRSDFAAATAQQAVASYYESPLMGDNATSTTTIRGEASEF